MSPSTEERYQMRIFLDKATYNFTLPSGKVVLRLLRKYTYGPKAGRMHIAVGGVKLEVFGNPEKYHFGPWIN